jgi:outer membrane lipoprotein-sorting protein
MSHLFTFATMLLIFGFTFDANSNATQEFTPASFRLDFNQDFVSITGKVKSSKGSIEYLYPSSIRIKEFKDNSEFISNAKNSWYYVPPFIKGEKGTVQINQAGSMVLGKLFDSLRPGLKDTDYFKVKKNKDDISLVFTDKGKTEWKVEIAKMLFAVKTLEVVNMKDLQKLEITYTDKKKVNLSFFNYSANIKFPNDYFVFIVPANTQIMK